YGLDRGFSHFHCARPAIPTASLETLWTRKSHLLRYPMWRMLAALFPAFHESRTWVRADEITTMAESRVGHATALHRPFLLFFNYMDAHTPYAPPANYAARFPPRDASPRERLISAYDASI